MKSLHTFNWGYRKLGIFGMMILPNKKNFNLDLIPGLRFGVNDYEISITLSWLIFSIEFDYTIKEQQEIKD